MRIFVIADSSKRKAKPVGVLIWEPDKTSPQGRFALELASKLNLDDLPLSLSPCIARDDRCATREESEAWVRSRIVPKERHNIAEVLRANGLIDYDEVGLLAACKGRSSDDDLMAYEVNVPDGFAIDAAQASGSRADQILAAVKRQRTGSLVSYAFVDLPNEGSDSASEETGRVSSAMQVGQLLRARRRALGLTQAQLAARAGITQTVLSRIESGNGNPTLGLLDDIAAALDAHLNISVD